MCTEFCWIPRQRWAISARKPGELAGGTSDVCGSDASGFGTAGSGRRVCTRGWTAAGTAAGRVGPVGAAGAAADWLRTVTVVETVGAVNVVRPVLPPHPASTALAASSSNDRPMLQKVRHID